MFPIVITSWDTFFSSLDSVIHSGSGHFWPPTAAVRWIGNTKTRFTKAVLEGEGEGGFYTAPSTPIISLLG